MLTVPASEHGCVDEPPGEHLGSTPPPAPPSRRHMPPGSTEAGEQQTLPREARKASRRRKHMLSLSLEGRAGALQVRLWGRRAFSPGTVQGAQQPRPVGGSPYLRELNFLGLKSTCVRGLSLIGFGYETPFSGPLPRWRSSRAGLLHGPSVPHRWLFPPRLQKFTQRTLAPRGGEAGWPR